MERLKEGNFIAIFCDHMIEVKAEKKEEACEKAKMYFESREQRVLSDIELTVCQIPPIIGCLNV